MHPGNVQQLIDRAIEHRQTGRLAEAGRMSRQILAAAPKNFAALCLAGEIAHVQGRIKDALELLHRAADIDPKSASCRMSLGAALIAAGQWAGAEKQLREAVLQKPDLAEAWSNLAIALRFQARLVQAVECHQRAIHLAPRSTDGWLNYGITLNQMGQFAVALRVFENVLATDPGDVAAHFGRGLALENINRIAEANGEYARCLAREPRLHKARSCRIFALHYVDHYSREQIFADHVAYGKAVGSFPMPVFTNSAEPGRRLRVAILSPDLRMHSCAFFLEPILKHLDRERFELLLYHDHFSEDAISGRFRALGNCWRNFFGQSDALVEQTIRSDRPDILIDLAGHSGSATRLPLYARQLAPVQISYLGYPDTTGLPAMDYRFTDPIADPPGDEADRFATERLVRFAPTAWAYLPPAHAPEPDAPPPTKRTPVRFGSFNNLPKINDTTLQLWADVLRANPGSELLIKGSFPEGDPTVQNSFLKGFAAAGVSPNQVRLVNRTNDIEAHLEMYRQVDVALDTFPYHGTTTTCEALWMGVPVVTLKGDRHASRVGASLLSAVGHPEWIAADKASYVRIATELASDPIHLAVLHSRLRDDMKRSPLLDHAGQAARFGAALRACWIDWCKKPEHHSPRAGLGRHNG
jgi:protein O-GlcNAc transferase